MKLVIISNMAHYRRPDGVIVGHGATAREISALAELFDEVRHVACLHDQPAPASALPYSANNIELVPVPPAGGGSLDAKLEILRFTPLYARTMLRELRTADAVHVRCPANITLYAIAVLSILREPRRRWVKYAGAWQPVGAEPLSYKLQRLWLERPHHGAQVTINGSYEGQPLHVHSFANPCLTAAELSRGKAVASTKQLVAPIRLLFVGNLSAAKNPRVALETVAQLRRDGVDARLDVAGDGAERDELRELVTSQRLVGHVILHGALDRPALDELYDAAHFVILPSNTEGWPKVLSEGMAAGALPISTAVGSIPETLARIGAGRALPTPPTARAFVEAIRSYVDDPEIWRREAVRAVSAAELFSYSAYLTSVRALLELD